MIAQFIDWVKKNKRFSGIVGGGIIVNFFLFFYVTSYIQGVETVAGQAKDIARKVEGKQGSVPSSSQLLTLSDQVSFLKKRKDTFRQRIKFEFPKEKIQGAKDLSSPPDVIIRNRSASAREYLKDLFREHGAPYPEDALGIPAEPDPDRFMEQLRKIYIVKHLYELALEMGIKQIDGIYPGMDALPERLQSFTGVEYLCNPFQLRFRGTMNETFRLLYNLQRPGKYLQVLKQNVQSSGSALKKGGEPLLKTRITLVPVQTATGSVPEETTDEEESEDEDESEIDEVPW